MDLNNKINVREQSYERSDKLLEREKYLIFNIPFNRWVLFPCTFLVQCCIGIFFSWSIFNKPIDSYIYNDPLRGRAPITFYLTMIINSAGLLLSGPWIERNGPKNCIMIGGALFGAGHLFAAIGVHTKQIAVVYVGYGICVGFGFALCYLPPVSSLQKWFPDYRGLASGFAVCGLSAGTMSFSQAILPMTKHIGLVYTFVVLGCTFFGALTILALFFRFPPPGYKPPTKNNKAAAEVVASPVSDPEEAVIPTPQNDNNNNDTEKETTEPKLVEPVIGDLTIIESLTSYEFRLMFVMFLANGIASHIFSSRLSNFVQDIFGKSAETAATVVTINGAFNLVGRLSFGIISEKIGRKQSFIFILTMMILVFFTITRIITEKIFSGFVALVWTYTFVYGAGFGTIPAFLSDQFGSKNISPCHGVILTGWNISGVVGGFIFTAIYDSLRAKGYSVSDPILYNTNFYWLAAVVINSWIRKSKPFELLSKEQENEEWNNFLIGSPTSNNTKIITKVIDLFKYINVVYQY
ncbi:hypothetical protein PPL_04405 [Heterostelium album PN500]|uniref:Major facilitator superfamily (MFS) profile domain-containing protein n=1 Tax=Heterostelium pallidum (strain ATCC 26659 / Pp 5 / PN500) TaxID=670386 RepID=D3B7G7_HETP5|nr:hypothetical protein PPL_04405 [Heterostelium album PN500]EFA82710.1 hypothetical protein PPL_04405 [Heterostelium album PN500]|eukprot:XP_020434827.1 hypothetical protein PPL_04405 [Heterostelium album PN500]